MLAVVELRMERVLPRPRVGLLARMLRLEALPITTQPGSSEPVYLLPAGAEVHISICVHQVRPRCAISTTQAGPCCRRRCAWEHAWTCWLEWASVSSC